MSAVLDADEEEEETEEQRYQRFFGPAESSTEDDESDEEDAPPAPPRLAIESEASALLAKLIGEVLSEAKTRPERETARLACAAAGSFLAQIPGAAGAFESEASREDVLAYMTFPKDHWAQIASTNPLERVNKEIKRRADVIGIFPNDAAVVRLAGALMLEQNDEWAVSRRYMTLETLGSVSHNPIVSLPALAA